MLWCSTLIICIRITWYGRTSPRKFLFCRVPDYWKLYIKLIITSPQNEPARNSTYERVRLLFGEMTVWHVIQLIYKRRRCRSHQLLHDFSELTSTRSFGIWKRWTTFNWKHIFSRLWQETFYKKMLAKLCTTLKKVKYPAVLCERGATKHMYDFRNFQVLMVKNSSQSQPRCDFFYYCKKYLSNKIKKTILKYYRQFYKNIIFFQYVRCFSYETPC